MFWNKNKKNRYTPVYPSFLYTKVGFKGVFITQTCFPDESALMYSIHILSTFVTVLFTNSMLLMLSKLLDLLPLQFVHT